MSELRKMIAFYRAYPDIFVDEVSDELISQIQQVRFDSNPYFNIIYFI